MWVENFVLGAPLRNIHPVIIQISWNQPIVTGIKLHIENEPAPIIANAVVSVQNT